MADALNTTHNIAGYVTFEIGEGGFTKAVLSNPYAGSKLEVYPYGTSPFPSPHVPSLPIIFQSYINLLQVLTSALGLQNMENRSS